MGAGAFIEPLVVVSLLFGGTWVNRNSDYRLFASRPARGSSHVRSESPDSLESGMESPTATDGLLSPRASSPSLLATNTEPKWRKRELRLLGFRTTVTSPNTRVFQDRFLSRLLQKFPFLVEAWYWALIYWVRSCSPHFAPVLQGSYILELTLFRSINWAAHSPPSLLSKAQLTLPANMLCNSSTSSKNCISSGSWTCSITFCSIPP